MLHETSKTPEIIAGQFLQKEVTCEQVSVYHVCHDKTHDKFSMRFLFQTITLHLPRPVMMSKVFVLCDCDVCVSVPHNFLGGPIIPSYLENLRGERVDSFWLVYPISTGYDLIVLK